MCAKLYASTSPREVFFYRHKNCNIWQSLGSTLAGRLATYAAHPARQPPDPSRSHKKSSRSARRRSSRSPPVLTIWSAAGAGEGADTQRRFLRLHLKQRRSARVSVTSSPERRGRWRVPRGAQDAALRDPHYDRAARRRMRRRRLSLRRGDGRRGGAIGGLGGR